MTREERLAAGWVERWGLFDWSDGKWMAADAITWAKPVPSARIGLHRWGGTYGESLGRLNGPSWNIGTRITPRRFWTRKRPKPKPALAVGDKVMVRAKVADIAGGGAAGFIHLEMPSGDNVWVEAKHIVPAPKVPR